MELDCCRSLDLALQPQVWSLHCYQKEQKELEEDPCYKELRDHLVHRTGMVQDLGPLEYDHYTDLGPKLSHYPGDCLERCAGDGVDLGNCLPRQWR